MSTVSPSLTAPSRSIASQAAGVGSSVKRSAGLSLCWAAAPLGCCGADASASLIITGAPVSCTTHPRTGSHTNLVLTTLFMPSGFARGKVRRSLSALGARLHSARADRCCE
eukprot:4205835-Prymnesium_polylepis.1